MQHFLFEQLRHDPNITEATYNEFLRVSSLSMGLYTIPVGGVDPQEPHTEDEVYLVMGGKGWITVGEVELPVGNGSIVFVPALVEHRFHTVQEALSIVVFFAPAEYSLAGLEHEQ